MDNKGQKTKGTENQTTEFNFLNLNFSEFDLQHRQAYAFAEVKVNLYSY